ncbi:MULTISPECIES: HAMP domain-containing sensor histidine kinase [unclassified Microbacterium]|uniref:sensor histidine kinase n=1 Tax=unclassified Microbacterium TaxID=2609290 RepID=UPI00034E1E9C|nr:MULTISPECIES: HAMP domain-containing sensor histidine kinase [unclassified Microbacterium]EPD83150.1 hypothetical protein HMPREF1529_02518 [Microbacterium sp. oral taxon 186 str. F0373]ODT25822.1 MAG: hypothetical protein ABS64_00775 [Microbacterium sp. SCN 69-37]
MFASAVRRLTVIYTLIQLVLFGAVAVGIYWFVTWTFDLDVATQDGPAAANPVELGFSHLRTALIAGFCALCVIVPFTSYWMARAALAPLRRSVERQQRFIDDASHELRSPLTVIRGELELALLRKRTADQYRQSISSTLDATQVLVDLTEDLLLLAQEAPAELRSRFVAVPIDTVIRDAIRSTEHSVRRQSLTVRSAPGVTVHGIPALLVRAISNVLENAIKFTPDEGTITVTVTANAHTTVVAITDTGRGMTPDEVEHATERFWRSQDVRSSTGHGLGLSVVERIMHTHGGSIRITSAPGAGSTFDLLFPAPPER